MHFGFQAYTVNPFLANPFAATPFGGISGIGGGGGGGGPAPSAPTLVSAAVIGWQGAGDGHVDDILEITTASVWIDADTVVGQWQVFDGSSWNDISGATASTLVVLEAYASSPIRRLETATNGVGDTYEPSTTSLTPLALSTPSNVTAPIITNLGSGNIVATTSAADWTGNPWSAGGGLYQGFSYQWQIFEFGSWLDIPGATSTTTFWLPGSGTDLKCVVTAYNSQGAGPPVDSNILYG